MLSRAIEAIRNAQEVGRVLGQHHHAAHVGVRGRQRVPFRFLVGERGDQAPVDAGQVLRRLEFAAPGRQPGPGIVEEPCAAGGIEAFDVAEVAVMDARQRAVGTDAGNEGVGLVAQRPRGLAAKGPAELQQSGQ
jgi:hypothetical protein